jgi:hypothetical protein
VGDAKRVSPRRDERSLNRAAYSPSLFVIFAKAEKLRGRHSGASRSDEPGIQS